VSRKRYPVYQQALILQSLSLERLTNTGIEEIVNCITLPQNT